MFTSAYLPVLERPDVAFFDKLGSFDAERRSNFSLWVLREWRSSNPDLLKHACGFSSVADDPHGLAVLERSFIMYAGLLHAGNRLLGGTVIEKKYALPFVDATHLDNLLTLYTSSADRSFPDDGVRGIQLLLEENKMLGVLLGFIDELSPLSPDKRDLATALSGWSYLQLSDAGKTQKISFSPPSETVH